MYNIKYKQNRKYYRYKRRADPEARYRVQKRFKRFKKGLYRHLYHIHTAVKCLGKISHKKYLLLLYAKPSRCRLNIPPTQQKEIFRCVYKACAAAQAQRGRPPISGMRRPNRGFLTLRSSANSLCGQHFRPIYGSTLGRLLC